jgi:hypothetical protein
VSRVTDGAGVRALHRAGELERPFAADLRHLSAEQAATALIDRFVRTGYSQADVADPAAVRQLIRRDCRQRKLTVQTHAIGAVVIAVDEERNAKWLSSPEGIAYQDHMGDAALTALANVVSPRSPSV